MASYSYGVSSSRPELGTRSSSVLSEFQNIEWQSAVKACLEKCQDVIDVERTCADSLVQSGFSSPTTPYLFHLEKSFLDISSPSVTDGTFYLSLFTVGRTRRLYCRYFESGVFSGYFLAEGLANLRRNLLSGQNFDSFQCDHLYWTLIFNQEDISSYYERYKKQLQSKRSSKELSKLNI